MAGILGPNDLKQWAFPTGWDAARLAQLQLASGESYEQLVGDINAGLALANASLLADPMIASLVHLGAERTTEYGIGVSNGFEDHTEYGRPENKRGKTIGHMAEPVDKDRSTGWTKDFLERARRAQIDADIASIIQDLKDVWAKAILTRHFKLTYTAVGSGKSMPYADGGTADSTYIPPQFPARAAAFAYTHNHMVRLDGYTQAHVETTAANLWEHGYDAPFEMLVAQADVASWSNTTNVTGFVKKADGLIRYGNQVDLAQVDQSYIGVIETSAYGPIRVRSTARIPTTYWTMYKSWGPLDARNAIRVVPPAAGIGAEMQYAATPVYYPLEEVFLRLRFELAIANRIGAVCVKTGGAYATPTIS